MDVDKRLDEIETLLNLGEWGRPYDLIEDLEYWLKYSAPYGPLPKEQNKRFKRLQKKLSENFKNWRER